MSGLFKRHASRSGPAPDGPENAPHEAVDPPTVVMPLDRRGRTVEPSGDDASSGVTPPSGGGATNRSDHTDEGLSPSTAPRNHAPNSEPEGAAGDRSAPESLPEDSTSAPEHRSSQTAEAPPTSTSPVPMGFRERARLRRRLRYLRSLREVQLRYLGGLIHDLHRFGRQRDDLVAGRLDSLAGMEAEMRGLELALGILPTTSEVRQPGVGGTCPRCAHVYGSDDRFCGHCGLGVTEDASPEERS